MFRAQDMERLEDGRFKPVQIRSQEEFTWTFGPRPTITVDKFGGTYSMIKAPRRRWWERLLRRKSAPARQALEAAMTDGVQLEAARIWGKLDGLISAGPVVHEFDLIEFDWPRWPMPPLLMAMVNSQGEYVVRVLGNGRSRTVSRARIINGGR
jgi:hypothetical protein